MAIRYQGGRASIFRHGTTKAVQLNGLTGNLRKATKSSCPGNAGIENWNKDTCLAIRHISLSSYRRLRQPADPWRNGGATFQTQQFCG